MNGKDKEGFVIIYLELLFFVSPHPHGTDWSELFKEQLQTSLQCRMLIAETFLFDTLSEARESQNANIAAHRVNTTF